MKNRRQRMEDHPGQEVVRVERTLLEGPETFTIVKGQLVLAQRGGLPFIKVLDQAFDGVNVIALELSIAGERLPEIRRLDRKLEERIHRMIHKAWRSMPMGKGPVQVSLLAIIG